MVFVAIARPRILLALALGLAAGGFGITSVLADDKPGHSHAAGHGHGHDAAKAEKEIGEALAGLSAADREQAVAQRFCPMMLRSRLGSDGVPRKVTIGGASVLVCCKGCVEDAVAGGEKTLATVAKLTKVSAVLARMPAQDRAAAEAQKYCAIANKNFLGSMGVPVRLEVGGKPVFLCCKGCTAKVKANPAAALATAEALRKAGSHEGHEHGDHKHGDHKHGGHEHGDHKN